jgi:hypothetical protein
VVTVTQKERQKLMKELDQVIETLGAELERAKFNLFKDQGKSKKSF